MDELQVMGLPGRRILLIITEDEWNNLGRRNALDSCSRERHHLLPCDMNCQIEERRPQTYERSWEGAANRHRCTKVEIFGLSMQA